jgi:hypothetical protein
MLGCSIQRKVSHVESRVPAAVQRSTVASQLRVKLTGQHAWSKLCPVELRELLPALSEERLRFPSCPEALQVAIREARDFLRVDERSTLEGFLDGQCRSFSQEAMEDSLASLFQGSSNAPGGRSRSGSRSQPEERETALRTALRDRLLEVKDAIEPFEQWIRVNGEFVIPDEQLGFFDRLVHKQGCKLADQEVDQFYRSMHSLESLSKIEGDTDPQRVKVERFLLGIRKVIDRKLQEFFPHGS